MRNNPVVGAPCLRHHQHSRSADRATGAVRKLATKIVFIVRRRHAHHLVRPDRHRHRRESAAFHPAVLATGRPRVSAQRNASLPWEVRRRRQLCPTGRGSLACRSGNRSDRPWEVNSANDEADRQVAPVSRGARGSMLAARRALAMRVKSFAGGDPLVSSLRWDEDSPSLR